MKKDIADRLQQIENNIRGRHSCAVLFVSENADGTYSLGGDTYTRQQLDDYATARGTEVLIIDDL